MRPASLAADDTPMLPVLQHAIESLEADGFNADIVVLLQPTSPFGEASTSMPRSTGSSDAAATPSSRSSKCRISSIRRRCWARRRAFEAVSRRADFDATSGQAAPLRAERSGGARRACARDRRGLVVRHETWPLIMTRGGIARRRHVVGFEARRMIPYRHISEYQPSISASCRPGSSYKSLIEKRTHPIDELVARFGRIPEELLTTARLSDVRQPHEETRSSTKDHMRIVRCGVCDLVYVNPTFDEAHYQRCTRRRSIRRSFATSGISSHEYRVRHVRHRARRADGASICLRRTAARRATSTSAAAPASSSRRRATRDGRQPASTSIRRPSSSAGRAGLDLRTVALEDAGFAPGSFDCRVAVRRARASARSAAHAARVHRSARARRHPVSLRAELTTPRRGCSWAPTRTSSGRRII